MIILITSRINLIKKYEIENIYLYGIYLKKNSLTDISKKNPNKILVIKTYGDMVKFSKKYKLKLPNSNGFYTWIDWYKVSKDFGGIEIPKFIKKAHITLDEYTSWYYGWDIPSGVIWNIDIIKEIIQFP